MGKPYNPAQWFTLLDEPANREPGSRAWRYRRERRTRMPKTRHALPLLYSVEVQLLVRQAEPKPPPHTASAGCLRPTHAARHEQAKRFHG